MQKLEPVSAIHKFINHLSHININFSSSFKESEFIRGIGISLKSLGNISPVV